MNLIKLSACLICLGNVISGASVMAMENNGSKVEKCIEQSQEDKIKEVYEQEILSGKIGTYAKMYAFLTTFNYFQTEELRREAADAYARRVMAGLGEPYARGYVKNYLRQHLEKSDDCKTETEINDKFLELFEKYALKGLPNEKSQAEILRIYNLKRKNLLPKAQRNQKKCERQYSEEPCIKRVATISNIASIIEEIQAEDLEERERLKKIDQEEKSEKYTRQCPQEPGIGEFKKYDSISSIFEEYVLKGLSKEEIQAVKLKNKQDWGKMRHIKKEAVTLFDMEPQMERSKKQCPKESDDHKTEMTKKFTGIFEKYVFKGLPKKDTQSKFLKKTDGDNSSN